MTEEKQTSESQASLPAPQVPSAQVRDKRVLPEGVVPKQAQGYVIAGLAIMILLAVMFSKNHARPAPVAQPDTAPYTSDANARRIEELKQDLSAEQQRSQASAHQLRSAGSDGLTTNTTTTQAAGAAPVTQSPVASEPPRDPIADAERELAFKARFASNLISGADARAARLPAQPDSNVPTTDDTPPARPLRMPSQAASVTKRAPEVNINSASGQPFVLFEGTTIDAVLVDRLDGEFAGGFKVMVTNPVYSENRQHVLIPEGTFILGDVQKVSGFGQRRLALTFHRMLMPDGYSVDLDQFKGLDQAGETGVKGKVNNHYMQIFGASIALGIVAGAAESTSNTGFNQSGSDAYRQGIASSLSQSSANVLDHFINILPTHTIFEGHRVKVYLTQDMLLPAYENHFMPEVF
jgi:type IV secretion system protein VirB10